MTVISTNPAPSSRLLRLLSEPHRWRNAFTWHFYNTVLPRLGVSFVRSRYGVWLKVFPRDQTYTFCATGHYGTYLSDLLRDGRYSAFLDIGSNQGLYALIAAQSPHMQTVYAFEPNPQVFSYLTANIRRNRAIQVEAVQAGLGRQRETLRLQVPVNHSGGGTLCQDGVTLRGRAVREMPVRIEDAVYLDSNMTLPEDGTVICKIDTEGYEPEVIDCLIASRHWARIGELFIECDEDSYDVAALKARLLGEGFEVVHKNGSGRHYDLHLRRR